MVVWNATRFHRQHFGVLCLFPSLSHFPLWIHTFLFSLSPGTPLPSQMHNLVPPFLPQCPQTHTFDSLVSGKQAEGNLPELLWLHCTANLTGGVPSADAAGMRTEIQAGLYRVLCKDQPGAVRPSPRAVSLPSSCAQGAQSCCSGGRDPEAGSVSAPSFPVEEQLQHHRPFPVTREDNGGVTKMRGEEYTPGMEASLRDSLVVLKRALVPSSSPVKDGGNGRDGQDVEPSENCSLPAAWPWYQALSS
ncbi:hypothetical protein QYF61_009752 [Mycteria americana]|uniref:Uncharacterized protein n=1 Tax=Mycteria americana TaxID=33587 RepID=A0AAN7MSC4_MYCAM|nr:hypothetical protein QYF61_009752 [Mycteria americana]